MKAELSRYRKNLLDKYNAVLHAKSRVMSSMIAGPSNFPVRKNQKRIDTEMRRVNEFVAWDKKARRSMLNAVTGAASPEMKNAAAWGQLKRELDQSLSVVAGIDSKSDRYRGYDRSAFTNSVQGKLKRLAARGETELVNKALSHIQETQTGLKKPLFSKRNSIWSLGDKAGAAKSAAAVKSVTAKASPEIAAAVQFKGVDVVENRQIDRLQLKFPGKPDAKVRSELKGRGFRWSPKEGAWQRQLTDNARKSATWALESAGFERQSSLTPAANKSNPSSSQRNAAGWSDEARAASAEVRAKAAKPKTPSKAVETKAKLASKIDDVGKLRAKTLAEFEKTKRAMSHARKVIGKETPISLQRIVNDAVKAKQWGESRYSHGAAKPKYTKTPASTRLGYLSEAETNLNKASAKLRDLRIAALGEVHKANVLKRQRAKAPTKKVAASKPKPKAAKAKKIDKLTKNVERIRGKVATAAMARMRSSSGLDHEQSQWAKKRLKEGGNPASFNAEAYDKKVKGRVHSRADINTLQVTQGRKVKLDNGVTINSTWYKKETGARLKVDPKVGGGDGFRSLAEREAQYKQWVKAGKPKGFFNFVGPALGLGFGAYAFMKGATPAQAATVGADVASGGMVSEYAALRKRGNNKLVSAVGSVLPYVTFGMFSQASIEFRDSRAIRERGARMGAARRQAANMRALALSQARARGKLKGGDVTRSDGVISAHYRRQNGKRVKVSRHRREAR